MAMKYSLNDQSFSVRVTVIMLVCCCVLLGMYLLTLYTIFFDTYKFLVPIVVTANLSIDAFGAVLPITIGFALALLYFRYRFSRINYAVCFLFSVAIGILTSEITTKGLMSSPSIFSIWVSIAAVFSVTFLRKFERKPILGFKQRYVASLLIASSCSPLSKGIVDLLIMSSQFFNNLIIGGNGLADGVLVSTMYSPLSVTLITLVLTLLLDVFSQTKLNIP
jgi:hypothetical protein